MGAPTLTTATPPESLASRSCSFSLSYSDLFRAALDHIGFTGAAHDGSAVLGGLDAASLTEVGNGGLVQPASPLLGNDLCAGQNGDVLQHGLAAVAEARSLHCQAVDRAPQLVDHQHRQGLALHVLSDHYQVAGDLQGAFQHRHQLGR